MRGYSPPYYSPPRRGYGDRGRSPPYGGRGRSPPYGGRGRSPPRRGYGGYGRRKEQNHGSLLVRNIPLDCRPEELRVPFERFGVVRDVYIPKDYYTGEPRGFAFVQFVDSYDATEAQYHMNGQVFAGREISVVVAAETRKRPEDMRQKARIRGPSGYGRRRSSYYGRSRSRSASHSRSPHYPSSSRVRYRSRSYSPAPRRRSEYPLSPNERRLYNSRSPIDRNEDDIRVYSPDDGYDQKASFRSEGGARAGWRSPPAVRATRSLSGSRSRSPDMRPRHGGR